MDSTTKAGFDSRELTTTEIELAVAQIIDRMTRVLACQNEIQTIQDLTDDGFEKSKQRICVKYDVPADIDMGDLSGSEKKSKLFIRESKIWIHRWVCGRLRVSAVAEFMEQLAENHSVPVGWCFIGKYNPEGVWGLDCEIYKDLIRIGSRSEKKHRFTPLGFVAKDYSCGGWTCSCGYTGKDL